MMMTMMMTMAMRMQWATNAAVKMARNSKCGLMDGALPRRKRSGHPSWPGHNNHDAAALMIDDHDFNPNLAPSLRCHWPIKALHKNLDWG